MFLVQHTVLQMSNAPSEVMSQHFQLPESDVDTITQLLQNRSDEELTTLLDDLFSESILSDDINYDRDSVPSAIQRGSNNNQQKIAKAYFTVWKMKMEHMLYQDGDKDKSVYFFVINDSIKY